MSNQKKFLVVTAVGPDRSGIVSELSGIIHQAGANLEDSRMAALGGEFAVLLLASGEDAALERLTRVLADSQAKLGLHIVQRPTSAPSSKLPNPRSVPSHSEKTVSRAASVKLPSDCCTRLRRASPPSTGSTPIQYPWNACPGFPGGCTHEGCAHACAMRTTPIRAAVIVNELRISISPRYQSSARSTGDAAQPIALPILSHEAPWHPGTPAPRDREAVKCPA